MLLPSMPTCKSLRDKTGVSSVMAASLLTLLLSLGFSTRLYDHNTEHHISDLFSDSIMGEQDDSSDLESMYQIEIQSIVSNESQKRIEESVDPDEDLRLLELDIIQEVTESSDDAVPALMARLGPVRAALLGHGGALVVHSHEIVEEIGKKPTLSLVIDLDGACVSCGAAPGTLRGIQDDLLADPSISRIRFNIGMLEWFNEIQREFVVKHGGVTFC